VATRQTPERLARFAAEKQPPGRFLHDRSGKVQKAFGAQDLPAHFLFDASGEPIARSGAIDDAFVAALENHLRAWEREKGRGE
jgi:hypothetical protein